ncbi:MAG: hypothetical protein RR404_00155 [Bacilli bacterium]
MCDSIRKEVVVATILFVVVSGIIIYNLFKVFNIYDLIYLILSSIFYFRYLIIKKKQKDYIDM